MSPDSTTKRKRVDDDADRDANVVEIMPQAVRSEPWLEDGNVVLQAEGKQFRVHRSTLSLNSSIFRYMFGVPQPPEEGETVEGCPVVHLSDSAEDVKIVLDAVFQRRCVNFGNQSMWNVTEYHLT